jgi:hypothetical protein
MSYTSVGWHGNGRKRKFPILTREVDPWQQTGSAAAENRVDITQETGIARIVGRASRRGVNR